MKHIFTTPARRLLGLLCVWLAGVTAQARPVLTTLTPARGAVGSTVTISGTGFGAAAGQNVVLFDGVRAPVTTASATQLQVTVPVGASSGARVTVINTSTGQQGSTTADGLRPFQVTFGGGTVNLNTFRKSDITLGAVLGSRVQVADFNEDGRLDVLAAGNNLVLAYGNGAGGVSVPIQLAAGFLPQNLAVGDFTGDGHLDIVVLNYGSQDISLLVGLGAGGFASAQTIYSSNGLRSLGGAEIVEDIDGNGLLDVLIYDSGQYQWLINNGNGSFTPSPVNLGGAVNYVNVYAAADVNRDGRLDLVGIGQGPNGDTGVYAWLRNAANTGYGTPDVFTLAQVNPGVVMSLRVGDVSGDGTPDAVVMYSTGSAQAVRVLARNAALNGFDDRGTYSVPLSTFSGGFYPVLLADVDGDGALDVAASNGARLNILLNNGSGTFGAPIGFNNNNGMSAMTAGDLNGDGRIDFVTININPNGGTIDGAVYLNTTAVSGQNNAPTLNALTDLTIDEDTGPYTVPLSGISNGGDAGQAVTVTAVSSDPGILPNPTVSYISPTSTGSLRLQPAPDAFGTVTVTVTVSDGQAQNGTVTRSFRVIINPVNDMPTLDPVPDVVVTQNGLATVQLSGITSGAANENQTLSITATVTLAGGGATPTHTVQYTSPATNGQLLLNVYGGLNPAGLYSTNTVTVSDGAGGTITRTFRVYFGQGSGTTAAPTLDPIADRLADRSLPAQPVVALTGIDDGNPTQTLPLTVTAVSSNSALVSVAAIGYTSPAATGTLLYGISPTLSGSATITVTVSNGQAQNGTISRSFVVTVPAVVTAAKAAAALPALQLFPNPSPDGRFTLETTPSSGPATLSILDALGREVWRQQLPAVPARLAVQPAGLRPQGVYLVRLTTGQGTVSRRLLVQ